MIFLNDKEVRDHLFPFTLMRSAADIRIGILTIREKWEALLGQEVKVVEDANMVSSPDARLFATNIIPSEQFIASFQTEDNLLKKDPDWESIKILQYPWHIFERTYQAFLAQNGVADYDAAKATYAKIYDQVTTDLYAAQTQYATDQAKLSEVKASLARLNPEMSIERDLDLSVPSKIFALQQQRQDLLSRYLPTAQPVKDIDAQIASLQAMMNSGKGIGEATHKLGANPLYQSLMGQKFDLEADMASISGRMRLLQQQAGQVMSKLQGLAGLEAEYNTLSTERSALRDSIKTFTQRIQENEAAQEMKAGDDTVRVVEKASMPNRPKSLKRVILILSFLFAGFTALCAGLLRVYTRKGFANAQMAAKALDLPVLAQAKTKAA